MNWSSKWDSHNASGGFTKPLDWDEKKGYVSEADKAENDARLFGTGYMLDGKHVPAEDVINVGGLTTILTITHGHKNYEVLVTIIDDLALEYDDNGCIIYHVTTLTLFSKAVPGYKSPDAVINNLMDKDNKWFSFEYDKQPLLNWMKKVQENYNTAWTMLRCLTSETYADTGQSAKDIILKWCLSVPVA